MNRRKFVEQFAADKAAADDRIKKLLAEQVAAKAIYEESKRPELNYIEATKRVRLSGDALYTLTNNAEAQLRLHASPFLASSRERLWKERDATRQLLDRGGGVSNRLAVEARLEAIAAAIEQLDALAVSGESDLTGAAKRVLTIFADFETDPRYDVEFSAPPAKRHERFEFAEANHHV